MKKIILVGAVLFAIIVPILFFTASNDVKYELINQFGGNANKYKITGTWNLASIANKPISITSFNKTGIIKQNITAAGIYFTFNEDGTFQVKSQNTKQQFFPYQYNGTWLFKDNNLELTVDLNVEGPDSPIFVFSILEERSKDRLTIQAISCECSELLEFEEFIGDIFYLVSFSFEQAW